MGQHKEALDILIHELCDFVGAETYCVTNGQSAGVISTVAAITHDLHQTVARSSSVAEKPLPPIVLEDEYLPPEQLTERRALFTMLFKSYIAIEDRYKEKNSRVLVVFWLIIFT
jgi:hypothetical protein